MVQRKKWYRIFAVAVIVAIGLTIAALYMTTPKKIVLYKGNRHDVSGMGMKNLDSTIETSGSFIVPTKEGDYTASLSIFGIPYKSVTLKVLDEKEVVLGGESIGIRLYSDGLIVVGVGKIREGDLSPGEKSGIEVGDVITKVDGEAVGEPAHFSSIISLGGEHTLTIKRDGEEKDVSITPEESEHDGVLRVGLWVRDSTAGVGTLTYIDSDSMTYGALGHSVSDTDTGVMFDVLKGSIEECEISNIVKSEKGSPGELQGVFFPGAKVLGDIEQNTASGIFGKINSCDGDSVKVGLKDEIECGSATIRTSLDGKEVKDYEIQIRKVSKNAKNPSKGLIIEVTDENLLEKSGGIVQGMSGSPIIQNGKLIGAVTHVLVNDPRLGYGIFAENMIETALDE